MGYRNEDEELSRDQRMERLEDAVARVSVRKIVAQLKWGFQALLVGVGLGAACYGISFIITAVSDANVAEAREVPLLRDECQAACTVAGLGLQRAIVHDGNLVACGCVNESTHRTLWDDRNPPRCEYVPGLDHETMRCQLVEDSWSP